MSIEYLVEKLEKRLAEFKVIAGTNIGDLIEKLEKELAELKAKAYVKPWEPIGGIWFVGANGDLSPAASTTKHRKFGTERRTQKLAERASIMMRRFNHLLAYHDEFCPVHDPAGVWDEDTNNYFVYYEKNKWKVGSHRFINSNINGTYFPEDVAIELCRKLNAGEVVL